MKRLLGFRVLGLLSPFRVNQDAIILGSVSGSSSEVPRLIRGSDLGGLDPARLTVRGWHWCCMRLEFRVYGLPGIM